MSLPERDQELTEVMESSFIEFFNMIADDVHETAREKGWWNTHRDMAHLIALVHSELSEALEADRNHIDNDDKIPEYTGLEAEFADVIIRIMDLGVEHRLNIAKAIIAKMKHNETRPYRHGGKEY